MELSNKVIKELKSIPTSYPSERTAQKAERTIKETAAKIAPILEQKGLRIVKGGSTKSSNYSYTFLYLETVENTSHDPRTENYKKTVITRWEFDTKKGGYFNPLSCKAICNLCSELIETVESL